MSGCVSRPVSWLRLERYALGALDAPEAAAVERHVQACSACHECLGAIRSERVALPPLPAVAPASPAWRRWLGWGGTGALVAAAAAVLLAVLLVDRGAGVGVKGGELAIDLIRERDGSIATDPTVFGARDRFKVLVTCPPGRRRVDVVVTQGDERAVPVSADIECGNRVALPGAFRLTGDAPATVCAAIAAGGPRACVHLRPSGP